MINKIGQFTEEELHNIRKLITEFTKIFQQREVAGQTITLTDLSSKSQSTPAIIVEKILSLMGIPRLCGTDTIWKLLYITDHEIPQGRSLITDNIRQWLFGNIWIELEAQERLVVNGLNGLLVVLQQARLAHNQNADINTINNFNEQTESYEPIIFTEAAATKVSELIKEENNDKLMLRVFVTGGGCSGWPGQGRRHPRGRRYHPLCRAGGGERG